MPHIVQCSTCRRNYGVDECTPLPRVCSRCGAQLEDPSRDELEVLNPEDSSDLIRAVQLLEFPTITDKITAKIGKPLEMAMGRIPDKLQRAMNKGVEAAVGKALDWVLHTVDFNRTDAKPANRLHKLMAAGTGLAGGLVGGWGLVVELPVSTGIMLRSIADIARSQGENLTSVEGRLACLEVLAMDTSHPEGAHVDIGAYYGLRKTFSSLVADAARHLSGTVTKTESKQVAPILVQLINSVAARYGLTVSEEVAASLIPVIGGIGGAGMNYIFTEHFQRIAEGHFTVRRLERKYGSEPIQIEYLKVLSRLKNPRVNRGSRATIVVREEVAATDETN